MSLIYVTGISGAGKSTVCRELKTRGYQAYDVDENGLKSWYDKKTDLLSDKQPAWEDASIDWRKDNWLKIEPSKVKELHDKAKTEDIVIFLCGSTPNDKDIWDLFDKVICLSISDDTIRKRIAKRDNNDFGKHPDDLKDILGWNKDVDQRMKSYGAILIDAEQPVNKVVDDILDLSKH